MVAFPFFFAFTLPREETLAIFFLDELQRTIAFPLFFTFSVTDFPVAKVTDFTFNFPFTDACACSDAVSPATSNIITPAST